MPLILVNITSIYILNQHENSISHSVIRVRILMDRADGPWSGRSLIRWAQTFKGFNEDAGACGDMVVLKGWALWW